MNGTYDKIIAIRTPLLESKVLEKLCKRQVFLKMECCQPSGSFKLRGAENTIKKRLGKGVAHIYTASGGNAGMAVAYVGKMLKLPVTVVIPETTPKLFIERIKSEEAHVLVHGKNWNEAQEMALRLGAEENKICIHPYDDKYIWEACEKIIYEIMEDLETSPSAIILSVGGGGMISGVLQGLQKLDINIPVVAMETQGANSFAEAIKAGKVVNIGPMSSIAVTLSSQIVTNRVIELLPKSNVISRVISDRQALDSVKKLLDDHRILVEPSCGATMAAGYCGIVEELVDNGTIGKGPVVFIVCGGGGITMDLIEKWDKLV